MKKLFAILSIAVLIAACKSSGNSNKVNGTETAASSAVTASSIHQFTVKDLNGGTIDFAGFKGKKILVVNTASKCGYTKQYAGLEELYKKYQDRLVVVGFPANNFMGQEPGSNEEIAEFCQKNYGVTFPMAAKISVKGDDTAPIYQWLTQKSQNGVADATIGWNFNKFLLDENGRMISWFPSKTEPLSDDIISRL